MGTRRAAALTLPFLPIALDVAPSGAGGAAPIGELLAGLAAGVGVPFLLVATSGPLLQRWFSWTDHPRAQDPYFLYAAGNLGAAAGLVAYPFLLEPALSVADQSRVWVLGYGVALALLVGLRGGGRPPRGADGRPWAQGRRGRRGATSRPASPPPA